MSLGNTLTHRGGSELKLPDLVNPVTGSHTKLSVGNILGMILAAMVGFFAVATAQNLNKKVSAKLGIDTQIDQIQAERPKAVENRKRYV